MWCFEKAGIDVFIIVHDSYGFVFFKLCVVQPKQCIFLRSNQWLCMKKIAVSFLLAQLLCIAAVAQLKVTQLRCENKINPSGIETAQPRLSWQLLSNERNLLQTAYEIRTGTDAAALKAGKSGVWSSG